MVQYNACSGRKRLLTSRKTEQEGGEIRRESGALVRSNGREKKTEDKLCLIKNILASWKTLKCSSSNAGNSLEYIP